MPGLLLGSLLVNWILCSAANSYIEQLASEGLFRRRVAFLMLALVVVSVSVLMVYLVMHGFPESSIAREALNESIVASTVRSACWLNVLFSAAYFGFQLRRFVAQ